MVVTNKTVLPTEEELTVQEINLSWPILHAASFYVGKYCEPYNNEFILCRNEEKDATKCVNEGKAVTGCALEFFRKLKKHCRQEFDQYHNCLYKSSHDLAFSHCRQTQAALDKCVLEHINVERPAYGYFCEVKVHETKRPKPEEKIVEYPTVPSLPPDAPKPPARFEGRWMV